MKPQLKVGGKPGLIDLCRAKGRESAVTRHRAVMIGRYNKFLTQLAYGDVGLSGALRVAAK